jgi:hypothetical protein
MQPPQLGYVLEAMIFYEKKESRIIDGCSLRAPRSVLQYELRRLILSALPGVTSSCGMSGYVLFLIL